MTPRKFLWLIGLLLLTLACSLVDKKVDKTPTPEVVCTPPACATNEEYFCPGECPGGCGTTCATPTATPGAEETDTPTPQIACAPLACAENEVTYCPDECPNGCGVICATPTAGPTDEPTEAPTEEPSPRPACTPPACAADEVYYCPGECPQGCGTTCATPTPKPPTSPVIVSFTADRASIIQDEEVTVSWEATGGTDASLTWLGGAGVMDGVGDLNPNGGTATIRPHTAPVVLMVTNPSGSASRQLELTVVCRYAWVDELTTAREGQCPWAAIDTWAAEQRFEHGFMIWLQHDTRIYVFFNSGQQYRSYSDTFVEGDPESDPSLVPPAGLLQPVRGFGKLWRENADVRAGLGWALAAEQGYDTWMQGYQGLGMHNVVYWLRGVDGTIYQLSPMGGTWQVYVP